MKFLLGVALFLFSSTASCSAHLDARQTNETAVQEDGLADLADLSLPRCGGLCYVQAFPEYDCSLNEPSCMCANANLTSDISACLFSNCTIPNQLLVERISKTLCGATTRTTAAPTRRVTWSLFALACLFVGARCLARPERLHGSGYGTDDWTILACMALLIPLNALAQLMTDNGLGADNYTLSPLQITLFLKYFYVFTIIYTILVMLTKISILQLYLRIWTLDAVSVWFRRACWFLVVLHVVTIAAFVFAEIFLCTPVSYSWNYWDGLHPGKCGNRAAQLYALGAVNICYDVVVFVLPLHNFLKLNISWRRKTGVLLIFMVGMLVTICSIVRLQYLVKIGHSSNPTWDYNNAVIWSIVECNFSVVATCMPAMAGLLQRIWSKLSGKPMNTISSSSSSRAPINPRAIDPEKPMANDEMLRMEEAGPFNDTVTTLDSSDPGAATSMKDKSNRSSTSPNGIELRHEPPSETTATRLSYRDGNGRRHEMKIVDRPLDDYASGSPAGSSPAASDGQRSDGSPGSRHTNNVNGKSEHSPRDWQSAAPGRCS